MPYGNDINDDTSPLKLDLSWITKFNNDFNYSKELQLQKENGVQCKRVGFEILKIEVLLEMDIIQMKRMRRLALLPQVLCHHHYKNLLEWVM